MKSNIARRFNTTGLCIPEKHFMVHLDKKLRKICAMIDDEQYFTINRPRQYGKTTTLFLLENTLIHKGYKVISMSFEGLGDSIFSNEELFVKKFIKIMARNLYPANESLSSFLREKSEDATDLEDLSELLSLFTKEAGEKIVLTIDEVDKSCNNQIFLSFLGMLRNKFLERAKNRDTTFHSVILAGVHDVRNLKLILRPDAEQKYNSPWNIAVDFTVDMSFSPEEIATMLQDYIDEVSLQWISH